MKPRTAQSLRDALQAIDAVQWIVRFLGYEFPRFEAEDMPRWAIERQLGNLGQALRRGTENDETIRSTIPEIEQAIAFQTAIAKRYDGIDNQVVWATVIEDLDPLRRALRKLLTDSGEPLESPYI